MSAESVDAVEMREGLLARYEELRGSVLDGRAFQCGLGLATLMLEGMAAWVMAWRSCCTFSKSAYEGQNDMLAGCGDGVAEIVHVLTDLTLLHLRERSA